MKELISSTFSAFPVLGRQHELVPMVSSLFHGERDLVYALWHSEMEPIRTLLDSVRDSFPRDSQTTTQFLSSLIGSDAETASKAFEYMANLNMYTSEVHVTDVEFVGVGKEGEGEVRVCRALRSLEATYGVQIPAGAMGEVITEESVNLTVRWRVNYSAWVYLLSRLEVLVRTTSESKLQSIPDTASEIGGILALLDLMLKANSRIVEGLKQNCSIIRIIRLVKETVFQFITYTANSNSFQYRWTHVGAAAASSETLKDCHRVIAHGLGLLTGIATAEPEMVLDCLTEQHSGAFSSHFRGEMGSETVAIELITAVKVMLKYENLQGSYPVTLSALRLLSFLVNHSYRRQCVSDMRDHFRRFDVASCGFLTLDVFGDALSALGINLSAASLREVSTFLAEADTSDGTAQINYIDFVSKYASRNALGMSASDDTASRNHSLASGVPPILRQLQTSIAKVSSLPFIY
jgi:hypothetical protein